ncbi:sulfotransferase domain-containing protein [Maioricimonas sp. JC845]|uniref:sulfotransferase domain-containing protein n=1 Tax=Maioricimonas sp. JC845 TaxID=3232138 RepID=UPI0034588373
MSLPIHRGPRTIQQHADFWWNAVKSRLARERQRKLLFISCFPKSGSTYLVTLMHEITGFPRVHPTEHLGGHEQDFSKRELHAIRHANGVCHQHVKATGFNLQLANKYGVRPVVLVRNIFDIVPSLRDHFRLESTEFPTGYVPKTFFEMPEEVQFELIVRTHIPWYFNFLMSWEAAEGSIPMHWLTYEELFQDTAGVASDLLKFWNVQASDVQLSSAVNRMASRNTRRNKGVSGRGTALPEWQRSLIVEMCDACQLNDQTRRRIGIAPRGEPQNDPHSVPTPETVAN